MRTTTWPSRSATRNCWPGSGRCSSAGGLGRPDREVFDDGCLELAFLSKEVRVDDRPVELTPGETRLLAALVRHAGQSMTTDELREQAWGDPRSTERPASGAAQLASAVEQLSRKLGAACAAGSPIEAIPGSGYRYVGPAC